MAKEKNINILKQDRVTSTVNIVNHLVRRLTNKRSTEKAKETDYYVFSGNLIDVVIGMIQNKAAKTALVIDDLGLQVTNRLMQEGVKDITLALSRLPENSIEHVKYILARTFPDIKVNMIMLEELFNMDNLDKIPFDLVISNPPYGAIGANITDDIRKKIKYEEFICILPANDYKRNDSKDLFNYQDGMTAVKDGFIGTATVTTHVARIYKDKVNNMTLDEFERSNYIDRQLDKYFKVNHSRKHYAIDVEKSNLTMTDIITGTINNLFLFSERDCSHHHMPYSKTCAHYRWNILEDVDTDWIKTNYVGVRQTKDGIGITKFHGIIFGTHAEKLNFANFIFKNNNGFKFISKLFTAMNKDGTDGYRNCFPKVDWTRSWTVEEILADYGYDADEIQAVMDDLKNFKGMED